MRVPTIDELQDLWVYRRVNQYYDENRPAPDHSLFIAEFKESIGRVQADAWDEGYRDGHNDGFSDGHPLGNDREPEENPYRKQEEA